MVRITKRWVDPFPCGRWQLGRVLGSAPVEDPPEHRGTISPPLSSDDDEVDDDDEGQSYADDDSDTDDDDDKALSQNLEDAYAWQGKKKFVPSKLLPRTKFSLNNGAHHFQMHVFFLPELANPRRNRRKGRN